MLWCRPRLTGVAMSKANQPRRSVLYVPGSNQKALEKAKAVPADGLILDLEDAVAPDAKADARRMIAETLAKGGYGKRELLVRVNSLSTPWGYEDLMMVAKSQADGVVISKVQSSAQVRQVEAIMTGIGASDDLSIWCMMETPRSILKSDEIAESSAKLAGLVMGTSDLVKDLHALHSPSRLSVLTSLSMGVLAARAHGLAILDGVHLDLNDDAGFEQSCLQGLELGFDGKTLIHPKTIPVANRIFSPSPDDIQWSLKVIIAHAEATQQGQGVVLVEGKLIESLHVEEARRIVSLAERIAEMNADLGVNG